MPIVLIKALKQAFLKAISLFYKRSREVPCISFLVAAGFVLNAIFPLEYFSNMAVMDEIVSQRVEFSCALSVFLCKSVLSFCEFNFGEDFFHQVIGITSRCQACSKVFNVLLKHYFRRVCPQEPKSFFFNEAFLTPAGWQLL